MIENTEATHDTYACRRCGVLFLGTYGPYGAGDNRKVASSMCPGLVWWGECDRCKLVDRMTGTPRKPLIVQELEPSPEPSPEPPPHMPVE